MARRLRRFAGFVPEIQGWINFKTGDRAVFKRQVPMDPAPVAQIGNGKTLAYGSKY